VATFLLEAFEAVTTSSEDGF